MWDVNVAANFPGYVNVLGTIRSKGALIGTAAGMTVVGGGIGAVASNQTGEKHSIARDIGIGVGGAAGAVALGVGVLALAGKGPRIGSAFGNNFHQVGTGQYRPVPSLCTAPDGRSTYNCIRWEEIMKTIVVPGSGGMHANKAVGGAHPSEAAANAVAQQYVSQGKGVAVLDLREGHQVMRTSTSGVDSVHFQQADDPRVASFGDNGILKPGPAAGPPVDAPPAAA